MVAAVMSLCFCMAPAAVSSEGGEPGLAALMADLQQYTLKLDLSIQGKNSPLAAFYLHELEETAATIIEEVGEYDGHPVSALTENMLLPALSGLEVAIGAGEADEGMVNLLEACNACHAATEHAFIVIGRAKGNPFNQVFEGQR
jgi:hypothetical protein